MPNIQTGAQRAPHDLSHFVYNTGALGRLKVLSFTNVIGGDSFEMDLVGAFRLSPLRRGLTVDTSCDVFTFYMPYRYVYGDDWEAMLRGGLTADVKLPTDPVPKSADGAWSANIGFLGLRSAPEPQLPKWLYQTYLSIYNNYFKYPRGADVTRPITQLTAQERDDGLACAYLKTMWTAPLPADTTDYYNVDLQNGVGLDIFELQAATSKLHTMQQRELFMTRYRDIIEDLGGKASVDVDKRPKLLMHSQFWASGYDIDGTDSTSLGQFSGRTQQSFRHRVPRSFIPEHGVVMTVFVPRFPTIHEYERDYLVGISQPSYSEIVADPVVVANNRPADIPFNRLFTATSGTATIKVPYGQWYRYKANYVDQRYNNVRGFPFYYKIPAQESDVRYINSEDFDPMFQTTQLGHWNMQAKVNQTVYRRLPDARDAVMVS